MAIRNIAHAIQAGETSIGLAVGVESMSKQFSLCFYNCDRVFIRWLVHAPRLKSVKQLTRARKRTTVFRLLRLVNPRCRLTIFIADGVDI
jgi:hypothetical protein